jgi:hypothetical protein
LLKPHNHLRSDSMRTRFEKANLPPARKCS